MAPALNASTAMMVRRQLTRAPAAAAAANNAVLTMASRTTMMGLVYQHQQRGYATPMGPPPKDFRTSRRTEWPWDKESTLDRMGKFFLMTEMARGMYVLLEQFFRPPYV